MSCSRFSGWPAYSSPTRCRQRSMVATLLRTTSSIHATARSDVCENLPALFVQASVVAEGDRLILLALRRVGLVEQLTGIDHLDAHHRRGAPQIHQIDVAPERDGQR